MSRCAPPDNDGDDGFTRRAVTLSTHFQGAGHLDGNLTPECAAALQAVLESLGKKAGPEDDRTKAQRRHDALEEACRRLIASNCLPDVAGQAVQVQLHMTLDQLRSLPGASEAERQWAAQRAWRAGRAAEDGQPGWITDPVTAEAYACDAQIAPIVTGYVDPAALDAMIRAWLAAFADPANGGSAGPAWPHPPATDSPPPPRRTRPPATPVPAPAGPGRRGHSRPSRTWPSAAAPSPAAPSRPQTRAAPPRTPQAATRWPRPPSPPPPAS